MNAQIDLIKINDKIRSMKKEAEELIRMGKDLPAIGKNTARILASIKMLELNITDTFDL